MRQDRPPPPVTIRGGPATAAPRDLPEVTPGSPPRRSRGSRAPLVLTGLVLVAAIGIAELRDRAAQAEAARAEAERARTAVVLELSAETSGSTSYDAATDSVTFLALLRVRNAGGGEVTIHAVDLPGVQLLAPATLDVGRERGLTLRGQRSCTDDLAGLLGLDTLPLEVRSSTGEQSVDLALGGPLLYGDAIRRACGVTRAGLS